MMSMTKHKGNTTIQLSKKMRDELKALGTKGETYDDIVKRLIDTYKREEKG
jgi:hypothetical protein